MIEESTVPVGWIQWYFWSDYPEHALQLGAELASAGMDPAIGEVARTGLGLGPVVICEFLERIVFVDTSVSVVITDPEEHNFRSLRAFKKAGFTVANTVQLGGGRFQPENRAHGSSIGLEQLLNCSRLALSKLRGERILVCSQGRHRKAAPKRTASWLTRYTRRSVRRSKQDRRTNRRLRLYGTFAALRQIDIGFEQGRCYLLLGENGAGKSTLLRTIAGLLRPTFGTVTVFGGHPTEHRDRIGYMSHAPMLYDELTGIENLRYFGSLYRTRPCLQPEEAMRATGLDPALPRPIGQHRKACASAPPWLECCCRNRIYCSSTSHSPTWTQPAYRQMLALLTGLRAQGRTIILTTHQRDLAAPLADAFVTMQAGSVISVADVVGATA